jgi:1-acyl-sn-glycerol-3-phosphate acyltransferase
LKYLHLVWILLNLLVSTLIIGLVIILFGLFDTQKKIIGILPRVWGKWFLFISGVNYTVSGAENLKYNHQYIFLGNHESHLDIPLAVASLPFNLSFFAKKELFSIPVFGWAMKSAGMIRVDRKNKTKAKRSVNHALQHLQDTTASAVLFPEGTRSTNGKLLPFKKGGFILAIRSKLPIVPITIIQSGNALPKGSLFIRKQHIQFIIDKPIYTENYCEDDRNVLLNQCREVIQKNKTVFE